MRALRIHAPGGPESLVFEDAPEPEAPTGDVLVEVRACGLTPNELEWSATFVDRSGRPRTPSIPAHEVSGVVAAVGFGTTGFDVGDDVFGLTDSYRDGAAAQFVSVEARNLARKPAALDHHHAAALPQAGLTAWQALFRHGNLTAGQTVIVHGAGGAVGSMAVQLAVAAGARVVATGRADVRDLASTHGAEVFVDLGAGVDEELGERADMVFDTIGGDVLDRSVDLVKPGGTLVSVVASPPDPPDSARSLFFVVEPDREQLAALAASVAGGRLLSHVGAVYPLADGREAFEAKRRGIVGKVVLEP